jgi:hypothetical protein
VNQGLVGMEEVVGREEVGMDEMEHLECLSLVQLQLMLQLLGGSVSHCSGWQGVEIMVEIH